MSLKSFHNRNKRRDKKAWKKKTGMRIDRAAVKLAEIIQRKVSK